MTYGTSSSSLEATGVVLLVILPKLTIKSTPALWKNMLGEFCGEMERLESHGGLCLSSVING